MPELRFIRQMRSAGIDAWVVGSMVLMILLWTQLAQMIHPF